MVEIKSNLYVNKSKIQELLQKNSEYYIKLTNGNILQISKEVYNALKGDEPND